MDIHDIQDAYNKAKDKYAESLSKYRAIYKAFYPEEYEKLKKLAENGLLPQYTYKERCTYPEAYKFSPELFPCKEKWGDIPANFYDPINLRRGEPELYEKFNYYDWEDFPCFAMSEKTREFLCTFSNLINFLHDFEWVTSEKHIYYQSFSSYFEPDEIPFFDFTRYVDSRTCHFDHESIIITDPCYIMKSNSKDWDICEYGSAMEKLGYFTNDKYATADTLYGDWSCTTYNTDTKEEIGYYCADAGLVSVFSLEQVLNYNPEYNPAESPWCVTLINDFTGDVTLKTRIDEWQIIRYVEGKGTVNFIGTQTGL